MDRIWRNRMLMLLGLTATLGLVVIIGLAFTDEKIDLSNLIQQPYEVVEVVKRRVSGNYIIIVKGTLSEEQDAKLVQNMYETITKFEKRDVANVMLHVYKEDSLVSEGVKVEISDSGYSYSLVVEDEEIKKYSPIFLPDIEPNVMASNKWKIENSQFDVAYDLMFHAELSKDLSHEVVMAQVKGLVDEMTRINIPQEEEAVIKVKTNVKNDVVYYDSTYSDYLIQQNILLN